MFLPKDCRGKYSQFSGHAGRPEREPSSAHSGLSLAALGNVPCCAGVRTAAGLRPQILTISPALCHFLLARGELDAGGRPVL